MERWIAILIIRLVSQFKTLINTLISDDAKVISEFSTWRVVYNDCGLQNSLLRRFWCFYPPDRNTLRVLGATNLFWDEISGLIGTRVLS